MIGGRDGDEGRLPALYCGAGVGEGVGEGAGVAEGVGDGCGVPTLTSMRLVKRGSQGAQSGSTSIFAGALTSTLPSTACCASCGLLPASALRSAAVLKARVAPSDSLTCTAMRLFALSNWPALSTVAWNVSGTNCMLLSTFWAIDCSSTERSRLLSALSIETCAEAVISSRSVASPALTLLLESKALSVALSWKSTWSLLRSSSALRPSRSNTCCANAVARLMSSSLAAGTCLSEPSGALTVVRPLTGKSTARVIEVRCSRASTSPPGL